ncbi:MAG: hypothetical protein EU543_01765 [Promethearchaeota archaeon]|nr:MAG: hypothetical protein EU543_01765 [Candidatus Lokiarchaeota archaeon]
MNIKIIEKEIEKNSSKLKQLTELKELILRGANGFDVLFEIEKNYQLTYIFDKVDKSILKEIGEHKILNEDVKSLGNEILITLNSQIYNLEQNVQYLNYKLKRVSNLK